MDESHDISAFLYGESWLAKAFLFFAALSAVLVPISWFSHGIYVYLIIYPMGLAWMVFGFALFFVLGKRNIWAMLGKQPDVVTSPLPVIYWYCLGISLAYFLLIFFGYFLTSPERVPLGPTVDLRVFASGYLALNLGAYGFAHSAGRSKRNQAAA